MNIILIGPHGAGKTTIGRRLARALGVPFHHELGREMAEDPSWRPDGATAADAAADFDRELFARELARDFAHPGVTRVVESWHPTNVAYAAHRSPAVAAAWLDGLRTHCRRSRAVAIELMAPRAVLAERQSEAGDLEFFLQVGQEAARWTEALGIPTLSCWPTHTSSPDALVATILESLQGLLPSVPSFTRSLPCA